jgi:hypothetical protein
MPTAIGVLSAAAGTRWLCTPSHARRRKRRRERSGIVDAQMWRNWSGYARRSWRTVAAMATEPRRTEAECLAQGEQASADPTCAVELIAIKDGWLATTADSRRAAYGTTKEAALAAWAQSEERATRLLKRYWQRFPGAVLATFGQERRAAQRQEGE